MAEQEYEAFLLARYGVGQSGIDEIAAYLLERENHADPCEGDVEWPEADEDTRYWYQNRVREVLDAYLRLVPRRNEP